MFTLIAIVCCLGLALGMCVAWTGGELPIGPEIPEVPDDPQPAPKYLVAILPIPVEEQPAPAPELDEPFVAPEPTSFAVRGGAPRNPAPPEDKPGLPEPYDGPVPRGLR